MAETMDEALDTETVDTEIVEATGEQGPDPWMNIQARTTALVQAVQINISGNADSVIRDATKFEEYILHGKIETNTP